MAGGLCVLIFSVAVGLTFAELRHSERLGCDANSCCAPGRQGDSSTSRDGRFWVVRKYTLHSIWEANAVPVIQTGAFGLFWLAARIFRLRFFFALQIDSIEASILFQRALG